MIDYKDVFISYGRAESKTFATKVHDQLVEKGYSVWFDQNDIPLAVDFQSQIDDGITKAHTFVFIISPHAIKSPYCLKEIELAVKFNKRIIPILHVEPIEQEIWDKLHPTIAKLNWIYMREKWEAHLAQADYAEMDNFDFAFQNLVEILEKHKDYVYLHTKTLVKALKWERNQRQSKYLLVGEERLFAEKWLLQEFPAQQAPCVPTDSQCHYICEAKKNAENMMTDAFISCAIEDKEIRAEVTTALARHAITTWISEQDLKSGQDQSATYRGIEKADNFIFFISKESSVSISCLKELKHASNLNKRIIPLMIEGLEEYEIPKRVRNTKYIDFTDNVIAANFDEDIDDLLNELNKEADYYHKHKSVMVQSLKWERQNRNDSILLRGYNLQHAQDWLRVAKRHSNHPPLPIHEEFIEQSYANSAHVNTEVFISYSRTDGDFARKLNDELQIHGKNTWFDQESISPSADFKSELFKGIEDADNFLFIISPDAIYSDYCKEEVRYAASLNKRMISILYRDVDSHDLPSDLVHIQWIDFNINVADFHTSFGQLIRSLDLDREYVRSHTRWLQSATSWEKHEKSDDYLLRGGEFAKAVTWLQESQKENKEPMATGLQLEFIQKSGKVIEVSKEKERLQEEKLLTLEQERTKSAEIQVKKQKRTLWIISSLLLINILIAVAAVVFYFEAKDAKEIAEEKTLIATHKEDEANKAKAELEKILTEMEDSKQEVERERDLAKSALVRAGLASEAQMEAEKSRHKAREAEKQSQDKLTDLKIKEREHINTLENELHKTNAELARLVQDLRKVGVIRPAVKKRLDEVINQQFSKLNDRLEKKRVQIEKE
jgi:hypothetical protein